MMQSDAQTPFKCNISLFFMLVFYGFYDLYDELRYFLPAGILHLRRPRVLMELVQPLAKQIDSLR